MALRHENKQLELVYVIEDFNYPLQAIGNIGSYKFYYRAEDGICEFRVADDFSIHANPCYIENKEQGYMDTTNYKTKDLNLDNLPTSIEECAKKFLAYQKENKYVYRDRYVAFIDIIGFKNIIYTSIDKPMILKEVLMALEELQYEFIEHYKTGYQKSWKDIFAGDDEGYSDYDKYKIFAHQVSDCIIISNLAHKEGSLENIVQKCSLITHMLIERGLLCRGYIQYGKALHDDKHIVGPAYIAAYLAESKEKNIAIVLSKETYKIHEQYKTKDPVEQSDFKWNLKKYNDDNYYIDYFNDYMHGNHVLTSYKDHYEKLRNKIIEEYKTADDKKTKNKYSWMIGKFNDSKVVKESILQTIPRECSEVCVIALWFLRFYHKFKALLSLPSK